MICKICESSFEPLHHKVVCCSRDCTEKNFQRIKKEYYRRNRQKVIDRSEARRKQLQSESGWKPRPRRTKEELQAYQKAFRQDPKNKDAIRESTRNYKLRNPLIAKAGHLRRKFGISLDQFNEMLAAQNGVCAICGEKETRLKKNYDEPGDLCVDHCHKTGKIRGLLCFKCNSAIGKLRDSSDGLTKALEYLRKAEEK